MAANIIMGIFPYVIITAGRPFKLLLNSWLALISRLALDANFLAVKILMFVKMTPFEGVLIDIRRRIAVRSILSSSPCDPPELYLYLTARV